MFAHLFVCRAPRVLSSASAENGIKVYVTSVQCLGTASTDPEDVTCFSPSLTRSGVHIACTCNIMLLLMPPSPGHIDFSFLQSGSRQIVTGRTLSKLFCIDLPNRRHVRDLIIFPKLCARGLQSGRVCSLFRMLPITPVPRAFWCKWRSFKLRGFPAKLLQTSLLLTPNVCTHSVAFDSDICATSHRMCQRIPEKMRH